MTPHKKTEHQIGFEKGYQDGFRTAFEELFQTWSFAKTGKFKSHEENLIYWEGCKEDILKAIEVSRKEEEARKLKAKESAGE